MENLTSYISINPEIRFGKPCIRSTRIAVTDILQWLASGMSFEEILNDYPDLQDIHIRAALNYAPKVLLLKTGNQSRKFIEQILINTKDQIKTFIESSEYGILELI